MTLGTSVGTGTDIHWRSINAIRFLSVDAVQKAASGHPGAPMGAAPVAYVLWTRFLRHNPANPDWANRDRFLLSAGHASMLLYSLLHLTGYDLPLGELKQFRQWGSKTPGHPEHGLTPGVEATTGPLGQGFANGVGMAIAERMLASSYNRPGHELIDHRTFALCSDGDLMEGIASEAASLAGTLELGKITYLYDDNEISIEGETDLAFRESVPERFRSYGWHVVGPVDGNDLDALEQGIAEGVNETGRPSLVVVKDGDRVRKSEQGGHSLGARRTTWRRRGRRRQESVGVGLPAIRSAGRRDGIHAKGPATRSVPGICLGGFASTNTRQNSRTWPLR